MAAALLNTDHSVSKCVISEIIAIDYLADSVKEISSSSFYGRVIGEAFLTSYMFLQQCIFMIPRREGTVGIHT